MSCPTYALPCSISLDPDGYEDPQLGCCPLAKHPQSATCTPHSFGWVGEYDGPHIVQRLTIANSLSFSKACKPLFGGCPPAIFPVVPGATTEATVADLVTAVNQILVRLRSCGILANVLQTQSKAQFHTAKVAGATACDNFVVTKATLAAVTGDAAVAALVQQWEALGLPASIDEITFTRYYIQMYTQL
jgi:hypothetical protein